jgi:hypothetical protein
LQFQQRGTVVQSEAEATDRKSGLVMFWRKWLEALLLLGGILVVVWVIIQGTLLLLLG